METDEKALALHKESIIIDGLEISNWSRNVFENMRKGGLTAVNATVAVIENFIQTMANIAWWHKALEENSDLICQIRNVADIKKAKETGRTGIIFGFQNLSPIEDDLDRLAVFHDLGVRVMQVTYMEANYAGQGCLERIDAGLTGFGIEAVEQMNRLGILIDLSHVGHHTTMDAIEASTKPVAFTHANPKSICNHPRNKSDEAIKAVARKGGVIGATIFPAFLPSGNKSTLIDFIDVISYLIEMVGIDHVGVGTDFTEGHPKEWFDWILTGKSKRGPALSLDHPLVKPEGIQYSGDFSNITAALLAQGFAHTDIKKIMGLNFMRLFEAVW
jgi:membrane dipeptidase